MDFDDLFEHHNNQSKHSNPGQSGYYHKGQYYEGHHSCHNFDKSYYLNYLIDKIKNNRRLKIWIGMLGIILLAIIIALAIILIPLIVKLINFISQQGIQGIINIFK